MWLFGDPSNWALMKSPAAGMNVSSVPAINPRQRERQSDLEKRLEAAGEQAPGRLDEPLVDRSSET